MTEMSTPARAHRASIKAFVLAAIAVTLGDAADGVVFFALSAGLNPIAVLQYIASGLIGQTAFSGGLATAGLGLLIHTFLSFGFTAILFMILYTNEFARKNWIVTGALWGAAVYLFMNFIALPHSNVSHSPITIAAFLNGVIGHSVFVGIVPAYFARKEA